MNPTAHRAHVPEATTAAVLLIAMPWHWLRTPSLQLGLLQSVLHESGIPADVRTLAIDYLDYCYTETAGLPASERIGAADYDSIVTEYDRLGIADWIFAVPPFRDEPESDARFLAALRRKEVPEGIIAKAITMKRLVPPFLDRAAGEILAAGPRVVGFTTTFAQTVPSLVLAKILKQRDPSLAIVFGGSNCESTMGAALHRSFPWVDVVVRGEAERIAPEVMHDLLAGKPPRPQPGLCYRVGDSAFAIAEGGGPPVAVDDLPLPKYDEYFDRLAKASFAPQVNLEVQLLYESARGCWWGAKSHCTFCGLNAATMAFRSKSPSRVVADLTTLAGRYRHLDFQVVDSILAIDYFRDVLPRLRDSGYDLRIFWETKSNLKKEQVRLLREAGVVEIQPGIESLSTPILERMRKGVTAFQNIRLLKWCAEYGIRPHWNVIYGFPGEPPEEYARMADTVPSLTHLQPPWWNPLALHRFSPYHSRPHEFGIEIAGPRWWLAHVYPVDSETLNDLAYAFEYRHLDGRRPETYGAPMALAVEAWRAGWPASYRSLRYRRGPDFLSILDRRPGQDFTDYTFGSDEGAVYLACEDGATAAEACARVRESDGVDIDVNEAEEFLGQMVKLRLMYAEKNRYLALALPGTMAELS
jgi:ribosomal peptide maturation radical SAM protein 1